MGAGLYLHVPFCGQKCSYCDFYSVPTEPGLIDQYLSLLITEAELRGKGQAINTVFWGGGTPSLLTPHQISTALDEVSRYFCLEGAAELTLEANPETLNQQYLIELRQTGINRLSLGVQSLTPRLLPLLGRRHTAEQSLTALGQAQSAGFMNLSCDLMYGIPGQTLADWRHDLRAIVASGVQHISLYCLELYETTSLGRAVTSGLVAQPNDDLAADQYNWACDFLNSQGLKQYEISNFARPGYECQHNINYWQNGQYVGLGPAACSYWQGTRACNVANLSTYGQLVAAGQPAAISSEHLSVQGRMAETVILGLRLSEGIDTAAFAERFGRPLETVYAATLQDLLTKGWLQRNARGYALPSEMYLVANAVFRSFLDGPNT